MINLILSLCIFIGVNFDDGSTDGVSAGSPSSYDNLSAGTIIVFFRPEALSSPHTLIAQRPNSGADFFKLYMPDGSGNLGAIIRRATTKMEINTNDTPLSSAVGDWCVAAWTFDVTNTDNSDEHIYVQNISENGVLAESTYGTRDAGSGAMVSRASDEFGIGNFGNTAAAIPAFDGDIWVVHYYNGVLTENQIKTAISDPLTSRSFGSINCVLLAELKNSTELYDRSGDSNSLSKVVEGSALGDADNPPINW